jgi:ubiquinone/menaquinone biosynthesis C-methylase UbiE
MKAVKKFRNQLSSRLFRLKEMEVEDAYNIWSSGYDDQPDNLMLALDEAVFNGLIAEVDFQHKIIADVGCGTGRHWKKIYAKLPARIIGYDVSEGMLRVLKEKFSEAETHQLKSNRLVKLENNSCDILISTLAIAHIRDIEDAFAEWSRVLKKDGHIIITDYHPDALSKGGNRTFRHNGKLIAVKNYIYPTEKIKDIADKLDFKFNAFIEKTIDERVKHYYEKQNAMKVYERFKGMQIIYGAHLTRKNAAE